MPRYKMVNGELQSNNAPCPRCGQIRKEINPNRDIPISEKNIEIAKYSSASPEQRREILKKRSHDHFENGSGADQNHLFDKSWPLPHHQLLGEWEFFPPKVHF